MWKSAGEKDWVAKKERRKKKKNPNLRKQRNRDGAALQKSPLKLV